MNIIVCVKQIPMNAGVKDKSGNYTVTRDNMESTLSPYDLCALEEAKRLKDLHGGKITAITMGVDSIERNVKEYMALGADEAVLVTDRCFAGSDTLATSRVLAEVINKIGNYDLIICGAQSLDGDTAQVGPEVGEKLNIPAVTYVEKIDMLESGKMECVRLVETGKIRVITEFPCLVTVTNRINQPRGARIRDIVNARKNSVKKWNNDDIGIDRNLCGILGSATQVTEVKKIESHKKNEFMEGTISDIIERLNRIVVRGNKDA